MKRRQLVSTIVALAASASLIGAVAAQETPEPVKPRILVPKRPPKQVPAPARKQPPSKELVPKQPGEIGQKRPPTPTPTPTPVPVPTKTPPVLRPRPPKQVAQRPANVSLEPKGGALATTPTKLTLTSRYSDADGYGDLAACHLLLNTTSSSGANAVYVMYDAAANKLYLRNDASTGWLGGYAPGSAQVIENSNCELDCQGTTVAGLRTTLTINWKIELKPSMAGRTLPAWLTVFDKGGLKDDWEQVASFNVGQAPPAPASGNVKLMAGSKKTGSSTTVVLKWIISDDWVPEQGYSLHRKGPNDGGFRVIADPLKETQGAKLQLPGGRALELSVLQLKARTQIGRQSIFTARPANIESSRSVFEEMGRMHKMGNTPYTGKTRRSFSMVDAAAFPKLVAYMKRFQVPKMAIQQPGVGGTRTDIRGRVTPSGLGRGPTESPRVLVPDRATAQPERAVGRIVARSDAAEELMTRMDVLEARKALSVGSLANLQVSQAMGLGYEDTNVEAGSTYTYRLLLAGQDANTTVPLAECVITVGKDPGPSNPVGLAAFQSGVNSMSLRWEQDQSQSSARVISYDIYRTAAGRQVRLNEKPHMVGPVVDGRNDYVDPVVYYGDEEAPVGAVKYEVIGCDAFGRATAPAVLDFVVADWSTPNPPSLAGYQLNGERVTVRWMQDPQAAFHIYRADSDEAKGGQPTWMRVNDTPLQPTAAPEEPGRAALAKEEARVAPVRKQIFSFVDRTSSKDHHYLYCLTALYPRNGLESGQSNQIMVDVPDSTPPLRVAGLTGKFEYVVQQGPQIEFSSALTGASKVITVPPKRVRNMIINPGDIRSTLTNMQSGVRAQGVGTVTPRAQPIGRGPGLMASVGNLEKATMLNSDLGGRITLSWQPTPLKAPVRYKIYRAVATAYRVQSAQVGQSEPGDATAAAAPAKASGSGLLRMGAPAKAVGPSQRVEHLQRISPSLLTAPLYTFVAETDKTTFVDSVPKARPTYYRYRVKAVNRWGVEGDAAELEVRASAMLRPPIPEIVSAVPNSEGGITLSWRPLDSWEECAKYRIFRKQISLARVEGGSGAVQRMAIRPPVPVRDAAARNSLRTLMLDKSSYAEVAVAGTTVNDKGYASCNDTKDLVPNATYSYTVVAEDADKWLSLASKPMVASPWKVKCASVRNLSASADPTGQGILLTWSPPAGEAQIKGYTIQRLIGTTFRSLCPLTTETRYVDFGVMGGGNTYHYRVIAVDSAGVTSDPNDQTSRVQFTLP